MVPDVKPLTFSGSLEFEDFVSAFDLHQRKRPVLVLILMTLAQCPAAYVLSKQSGLIWLLLPFILPMIGVVCGLLLKRPIWRSYWNNQRHLYEYKSGSLEDESIVFEKKDGSRQTFNWSSLIGYRTNDYLVLLYLNKQQFLVILRNMFESDADWQAALKSIATHLPKKFRKIKAIPPAPDKELKAPAEGSVSFTGCPTYRDYVIGRLKSMQNVKFPRALLILVSMIMLAIPSVIIATTGRISVTELLTIIASALLGVSLDVVLLFAIVFWGQRRSQRPMLTVLQGYITKNELSLQTLVGCSSRPWRSFMGYRIGTNRIFLFSSAHHVIIISRAMLQDPDQWLDAEDIITDSVPLTGTTRTQQDWCAECGCKLSESIAIQFGDISVCDACKPIHVQKLMEGME